MILSSRESFDILATLNPKTIRPFFWIAFLNGKPHPENRKDEPT